MVDAVGTTAYTYTSGGELYTEDGPFASDTVTNYYWNRQRLGLGLQQPTGAWTNGFAYDAAKRLKAVGSPAGNFYYYYDPARLLLPTEVSLPNSSYITNIYDGNARLLSTKLVTSGATVLDSALYGYNAGNQRTTFTNAAGTYVQLCLRSSRPIASGGQFGEHGGPWLCVRQSLERELPHEQRDADHVQRGREEPVDDGGQLQFFL